jgi:gliding motility-associated-like protein
VAPVAFAGTDQNIGCDGTPVSLNAAGSTTGTDIIYTWTSTDGTILSGASTTNPSVSAGNYTLVVTNTTNGCVSSDAAFVSASIHSNASFTATPDNGFAPLSVSFFNNSTNASTYQWDFDNGTGSIAEDPSSVVFSPGTYNVTLYTTSIDGCKDTATVTVQSDETSALIPSNVFTPNGDSDNEIFKPISQGIIEFSAVIYDRWGMKMYEWSDVNSGWDGKAKSGRLAPDGTYYYIMNAKGADGKEYKDLTGTVQLIK